MLQDSSAATQLAPRHWGESEDRPVVEVARMLRVALASPHVVSVRQFGGKLLYVDSRCPSIPHVSLVSVHWILIGARPRLAFFLVAQSTRCRVTFCFSPLDQTDSIQLFK